MTNGKELHEVGSFAGAPMKKKFMAVAARSNEGDEEDTSEFGARLERSSKKIVLYFQCGTKQMGDVGF